MYKTEFSFTSDPREWPKSDCTSYSVVLNKAIMKVNRRLTDKGIKPKRIEPCDPNRFNYDDFKKCVSSTNSTHT